MEQVRHFGEQSLERLNAEFRLVETGHSPVYEAPAVVAAARLRCPNANPLNGAADADSGAIVISNS